MNLTFKNFFIKLISLLSVSIRAYDYCPESNLNLFLADKSSNAFAHSPSTSKVKLSWDSFLSDDRRRMRRSTSQQIAGINIEATFEVGDFLNSVFSPQELSAMIYNETIPLGTSVELQNLTSGFRYSVVVTAIDGEGGRIENRSLTTEAVTSELVLDILGI